MRKMHKEKYSRMCWWASEYDFCYIKLHYWHAERIRKTKKEEEEEEEKKIMRITYWLMMIMLFMPACIWTVVADLEKWCLIKNTATATPLDLFVLFFF